MTGHGTKVASRRGDRRYFSQSCSVGFASGKSVSILSRLGSRENEFSKRVLVRKGLFAELGLWDENTDDS
ncbi:MAG: hypothetical protein AABZ47_06580 [Planctomycetota bacterium]